MSQVTGGPAVRHAHAAVASLSPRQVDVAALIAEGLTNAEIAARLVLTEGTVANHVEHILRRTGARNRIQTAVWLVEYRVCGPCRDTDD